MEPVDDVPKLGWSFWVDYTVFALAVEFAVIAVGISTMPPFSATRFGLEFAILFFLALGPAVSLHYYTPGWITR